MLEKFHQMIQIQTGQIIKYYRLDNNRAITDNHMKQQAKTKRVHFEFTSPYLLNKDSIAECNMRINIKKLWFLIAGCDLSKKLQPLSLFTTIYLKNWSFIKAIKEGIIPI